MSSSKGILNVGLFYVDHLNVGSEKDSMDILDFRIDAPEGQGLSEYL